MCVALKMKIKASNSFAPKQYRVACGKCEECRAVYKESWNFRLTAELEALMSVGWQCGFLTLTYSDASMNCFSGWQLVDTLRNRPLAQCWDDIPESERVKRFPFGRFPSIMCFNRESVSDYFISARQWLYRNYEISKEQRLRYIACCEFGSHTHRPHVHALLIFPPQVDARAFYTFLRDSWASQYGHVFPRYFEGGAEHNPFLVESYARAARYTAKYTTKDLYYDEYLESELERLGLRLTDNKKLLKNSLAFHSQSKSLGLSILETDKFATDEAKLTALAKGVFFVGEDKPRVLPIYLKNKILYDNKYVYEVTSPKFATKAHDKELGVIALGDDYPAKRLVHREASKFFKDNIVQIYKLKIAKYSEFFSQFTDEICMRKREMILRTRYQGTQFNLDSWGYLGRPWASLRDFMDKNTLSCDDVAALYLCYYGVKNRRFVHPSLYPYLYLQRYTESVIDLPYVSDEGQENFLVRLFGLLDNCFRWWSLVPKMRSEEERLADYVSDCFKSKVG